MGNGLSMSLKEFESLPKAKQLSCLYENQVKTLNEIKRYRFHQRIQYPWLTTITMGLFFVIKSYYSLNKLEIISLSFILGGGIGNLIDRIINGAVFDFLYFHIGSHSWPTFNFADSLIDVGIVFFILAQFIGRKGHASNIS